MKEGDYEGTQAEKRDAARAHAIEVAQEWWDSYEGEYEGAVVTGFILITEGVLPNGYPSLAWCAGNGQPPGSEGITGLPQHRIEGMLRHTIWLSRKDERRAYE